MSPLSALAVGGGRVKKRDGIVHMTDGSSSSVDEHDSMSAMLPARSVLLISRRYVDYGRVRSMLCQAR
jgi:hypothetical protein